ncbi:MAG TPA: helix-turn-helix domain-containing protein [Candidatus Angelobacter sp.]|nr:helix-turn-helix domain-containing protein [Candidatus Angelobacter sp.]
MTREEANHVVDSLKSSGLIVEEQTKCWLSEKGKAELKKLEERYTIPEGLNGFEVGSVSEVFWQRLTLVIHTLSHLVHEVKHYMTLSTDRLLLDWGKQFFLTSPYNRTELSEKLYQELFRLIGSRPPLQRTLLVHRLSGFKKEGVSLDQFAYLLEKEKVELIFILKAALQGSVTALLEDSSSYPLLSQLLENTDVGRMTKSAEETYYWFNKGFNLEQLAAKRHLKLSTIQDHIVEIARVCPKEVKERYLTEALSKQIGTILRTYPTRRLSELKKQLPEEVSYFNIRLCLAIEEGEGVSNA